ncbi:unnamed protein product, partial [Allacma fusca]
MLSLEHPWTIKNRDFYIFVNLNGNPELNSFLQNQAVASEIKYKLLVTFAGNKMILKTLCFYCANGHPSEIAIRSRNIFPDLTKNLHGKPTGVSIHYPNPSTHMYLKGNDYVPDGTGGGYLRPAITTS